MKKALAVLLAVVMAFSVCVVCVSAEGDGEAATGTTYKYADNPGRITVKASKDETEVVILQAGDTLQFLFDIYDKEGKFVKTVTSDEKIRVTKQNRLTVADTPLPSCDLRYCGLLTDIYQRYMTTEELELHIGE